MPTAEHLSFGTKTHGIVSSSYIETLLCSRGLIFTFVPYKSWHYLEILAKRAFQAPLFRKQVLSRSPPIHEAEGRSASPARTPCLPSPPTASQVLETPCCSVTIDSAGGGPVVSPLTTGWGDFSRTREERSSGCVGCWGWGGDISPAPVFSTCLPQMALATSSPLGNGSGKMSRTLILQTLVLSKSKYFPTLAFPCVLPHGF